MRYSPAVISLDGVDIAIDMEMGPMRRRKSHGLVEPATALLIKKTP
jgi:hypothetical protein